MLKTPIGDVKIYLDDVEVDFCLKQIFSKTYPNVTTHHLKYKCIHDDKQHTLRCILCNTDLKGYGEGGERLETIAFDSIEPCVRLSIGIDGEFCAYEYNKNGDLKLCYKAEYDGCHLDNGLELEIKNNNIRDFVFSVAWMYDYTCETSFQTWCMADPTYTE